VIICQLIVDFWFIVQNKKNTGVPVQKLDTTLSLINNFIPSLGPIYL